VDISERKRAEEELQESRHHLALVYETASVVLFLLAVEGEERYRFAMVNPAFLAVTGLQAAQVVGKRVEEVLPPAAQALVIPKYREAIREQQTVRWEEASEYPTRTLYGEVAVTPVCDESGACTHLVGTVHDMTAVRGAEQALRDSEERYRVLAEASRDLIFIVDREERALFVNRAAAQSVGRAAEAVVGAPLTELFAAETAAQMGASLKRVFASGEALQTQSQLAYPAGPKWIDTWLVPLKDDDGRVNAVLGASRDVTDRMRAQEELQRSEARLRDITFSMADWVWEVDEDGVYTYSSQKGSDVLGLAPEDIIGKTPFDLMPPDEAKRVAAVFSEIAANKAPIKDLENWNVNSNGERFCLLTTGVPMLDEEGNLKGYRGVDKDITERRQAEEAVRRQAEQLRRAVEGTVLAMSQVVEIRDPYTAGHERRVAELATAIAAEMGLDGEALEALRHAGLIHDIGKIAVPAEILSKPGRLSAIELELIKQHPASSFEILAAIDFGRPVAEMVRQHHERLDGSGYPQGLSGADILPEARILAVADVVEAMSSHRPYRAALGMAAALAEVRAHAGVTYDADVVAACVHLVEEQGFQFTP